MSILHIYLNMIFFCCAIITKNLRFFAVSYKAETVLIKDYIFIKKLFIYRREIKNILLFVENKKEQRQEIHKPEGMTAAGGLFQGS